ncbi:MAG: glycogen debranching protein GlgX [Alphaproteobacteria bacterium]
MTCGIIASDGSPEPLGLTLDETGANVAVFSAHASVIELCLFDAQGGTETARLRLPCRTGDVFHGHFTEIQAGQRYGLRAYGPFAPAEGHFFNPAKLLIDPYALMLDRPFKLAPAMFGYRADDIGHGDNPRPDAADSAPFMPKAVAVQPTPIVDDARVCTPKPAKSWAGTILYELHVRGFTKQHPQVAPAIRGTFAGLGSPATIEHLTRLGVTAVKIMPCAAWADERHLAAAGLTNYWGYNPIAFMAPDARLAPGGWPEIAASVAALHEAGIEVIIDVVLNHSGEGDEFGPTLSLRGLDNATYYRHSADIPRALVNDTGCGNTLALDRPPVVRLAMDALRAWTTLGGVDGFRFDLATVLGRRDTGFDMGAPLLMALEQDPVLRGVRLIAEPWDLGMGGYQLGAFPAGWGEWNDKFRDATRRFWHGNGGLVGEMATRFSGSSDVFAARHRRPSRSVNFVTAHDGFTLADLVAYERKHNEANGENNRDGADVNHSWNNGVEGVTDDPAILSRRRRDQRNLLATLMLARGTPMLAMGAELGHTQQGNNNAYAQDNPLSWVDWAEADEMLTAFTARLTALRAAHVPLRSDRFLSGEVVDDALIPDVVWLTPSGVPMQAADWENPAGRMLVAVLYTPGGDAENGAEADSISGGERVAVALNAGHEPVNITLPEPRAGYGWRQRLDTAHESGEPLNSAADAPGGVAEIAERSVAVFAEELTSADGDAQRHTGDVSAGPAPTAPTSEQLDQLARAAGISADWYDLAGNCTVVPPHTKQALLAAMGLPASSSAEARESLCRLAEEMDVRALPLTLTAHEGEGGVLRMPIIGGRAPFAVHIRREDGGEEHIRLTPGDLEYATHTALDGRRVECVLAKLPPQPLGRHTLFTDDAPDVRCHLTVAPRRCYLPDAFAQGWRANGLGAQLYSVRRAGDQGIGDFTTLAELGRVAAAEGGADILAINPLHALFPTGRDRASPYYPSDRRFLDAQYIDVAALAAFGAGARTSDALEWNANAIAALSATPQVDYEGVWAAKRDILVAAFADFEALAAHQPDAAPVQNFAAFTARGGQELRRFAQFQAISEARAGEPPTRWPAGLAACEDAALAAFEAEQAGAVQFHLFTQWLAERQFAEAAASVREAGARLGIYRDLAVGAAPDGAEVWANAWQFLPGASVGAPPDPIGPEGQNWGLLPPNPLAWRRSGYAFFAGLLAANMRHAGALRIDHAMGLARLFVIPHGGAAADGAYLAYPMRDLFAQVALESVRARCVVVCEDLGTVPGGFREAMDDANMLSYRVMW